MDADRYVREVQEFGANMVLFDVRGICLETRRFFGGCCSQFFSFGHGLPIYRHNYIGLLYLQIWHTSASSSLIEHLNKVHEVPLGSYEIARNVGNILLLQWGPGHVHALVIFELGHMSISQSHDLDASGFFWRGPDDQVTAWCG